MRHLSVQESLLIVMEIPGDLHGIFLCNFPDGRFQAQRKSIASAFISLTLSCFTFFSLDNSLVLLMLYKLDSRRNR